MRGILQASIFCLTLPVFFANAQSKLGLAPAEGDKLTYDVVVYGASSGAAVAASSAKRESKEATARETLQAVFDSLGR